MYAEDSARDGATKEEAGLVLVAGIGDETAVLGAIKLVGQLGSRVADPRPPDLDVHRPASAVSTAQVIASALG
ncbi:hypothetical protein GCM10009744_12460 [Kribbella alba]|uniref:Uncharacterized protein n=1 Tax=Kribbella alba TaxID=190197 RepID=A0ABP4QYS0_9ACTN